MLSIDYKQYLDKVFGCWLGKCVAGTIGAPYEGAKELFDFEYNPSIIENMLPNDDLDLQVLWLAVMEEKGIYFTSDDLAEAFYTRCPYAPGEYAVFKKNHARGLHPPVTGMFNNRYYIKGMGCPIRSEVWGCVAPGNPQLAAELSEKDGVLDHMGSSVYAEQFLAALEAAAFFEKDLDKLMDIGLSVIGQGSDTAKMIRDVRGWCKTSDDWRYVRSKVIRHYGHPDCTNMLQNIGITILSLYFGKGDFLKTTMIALNCGFDTDCTCATAGAILGLIEGADALMRTYDFKDQGFVLGVDAPRRSDRVIDLAEDTCRMGLYFASELNKAVGIENAPESPSILPPALPAVKIAVNYNGVPAIGIGDTRRVQITFTSATAAAISATATLGIPEGWSIDSSTKPLNIPANGSARWEVAITVPKDIKILQEKNLLSVSFAPVSGETVKYEFGLVGAAVWQVFGPFWDNVAQMPKLEIGESYYKHIPGSSENNYADNVRNYHLNTCTDPQCDYMTMEELLNPKPAGNAAKEGLLVNCYEDRISVNDLVGYKGPGTVYMVRRLVSPEDRQVGIQVGYTDAYKLWINGELISERDNTDWWTAENAHIGKFNLPKGESTIVVKLVRRSGNAFFSLIFATGGSCTAHYFDFASLNPNA